MASIALNSMPIRGEKTFFRRSEKYVAIFVTIV
jgi:hypothetical protein